MWSMSGPREDYAPSRIAYRVNRMWLSPLVRVLLMWVLPLGVMAGAGYWWTSQPETKAQIAVWRVELETRLRDQPDFQVRRMAIMGASPQLASEIRRALDLDFPMSVLDLPLDEISARVEAFDAVNMVDAQVMLGGALMLTVTERQPVAVWRHRGGLDLIDIEGHRVAVTDRRDGAPDLPLITALGANEAVTEALALYAAAGPISDRVRGLTRQGERRWDLALIGGQVIRLPETGAVPALQRVIALHEAGELLDRDVPVIDMRNPKRPTIRLGEDAFGYLRTLRAFEQGLKTQ